MTLMAIGFVLLMLAVLLVGVWACRRPRQPEMSEQGRQTVDALEIEDDE